MLASVNFNSGTGALVVVGNAIADTISLTESADHQSFTVDINNNASLQQTFNYSDVTSVRVVAGDGDDFVYNDLLIDTEIFGQNGNDYLEGGYSNDLVMGGNGIDTLVGRNGNDVLNGQDGDDWLFGGPGVDALSGITGNDNLYGGTGDDTLNGHGGNDSLWGDAGDDSLLGGAGDDLLRGQDGNDTIRGEAGDDWLVGGDGDDTLHGDAGIDELLGQDGNDILNGGADNDFIWGAAGDDTIRGNAGSDRLNGGSGNDQIFGNEGRDIIRGDGGDDTLRGGDGDDDLFGLGGTDTIFGEAGDDLLDAGGDVAADVLTGGSGLDRFVVLGNIGSTSVDVVTDLEDSETINGNTNGDSDGADDGGNSGAGGSDIQPFPGVLGLFGIGLTDSIPSLEFDLAVAAFGAGTDVGFGTTVFTVGPRKIAVQSTGGGFTGVGETSLLATFPAEFPADFATELIPFKTDSSTIHVEENSDFGTGAVNRVTLEGGGTGDFLVEQLGTATLGIVAPSLQTDFSQINFQTLGSPATASANRWGRTTASSLFFLGISGESDLTAALNDGQLANRNAQITAFRGVLQGIMNQSLLATLTFPDSSNRFYIGDDMVTAGISVGGVQACFITGGFDCDDYAEAAQNFIRNSSSFQAQPAAVTTYIAAFESDGGSIFGHAVNVTTYRPPAGGANVYFASDAQFNTIDVGITPEQAVERSLLTNGFFDGNPVRDFRSFVAPNSSHIIVGTTSFLDNPAILQQFNEALVRAGAAQSDLLRYTRSFSETND